MKERKREAVSVILKKPDAIIPPSKPPIIPSNDDKNNPPFTFPESTIPTIREIINPASAHTIKFNSGCSSTVIIL